MDNKQNKPIIVFISYSWDSEEHKAWGRKLLMFVHQFSHFGCGSFPNPLLHRDFKPDNILVREDGTSI